MSKSYFWLLMGGLAVTAVLLVVNDPSGTVMGMPLSHFARAAVGLLLVLFVGQGLFRYNSLPKIARDITVWCGIGVILIVGYSFRHDFSVLGDRIMGELVPGRATTIQTVDGQEVRLRRGLDGQYEAQTEINGVATTTLVDTGASQTTLSFRTADAVGIDTDALKFDLQAMTANGVARFAVARVDSVMIGGIQRRNMVVSVAERGKLGVNLLGMTFLNSLSSFEFRGDTLILRP